ncbi:MAG TPA: hypothetical protein DD473_25960 [Planctomycetaceae bacterium]|nr:hypothetical protein [Planctomycetaceae bacterium]|tara:strand:- start:406 stop:1011 length:606 start_codon:yes stop_codon:yes gene_type:complete
MSDFDLKSFQYLADELSSEEVIAFEQELLDNPELQIALSESSKVLAALQPVSSNEIAPVISASSPVSYQQNKRTSRTFQLLLMGIVPAFLIGLSLGYFSSEWKTSPATEVTMTNPQPATLPQNQNAIIASAWYDLQTEADDDVIHASVSDEELLAYEESFPANADQDDSLSIPNWMIAAVQTRKEELLPASPSIELDAEAL